MAREKKLILRELKTAEEMLDYIYEHFKTNLYIYKKGTKKHSFYKEVLEQLAVISEDYDRRYEVEMNFNVIGIEHTEDGPVTGLIASNGMILKCVDENGEPLAFTKEFIDRLKGEKK